MCIRDRSDSKPTGAPGGGEAIGKNFHPDSLLGADLSRRESREPSKQILASIDSTAYLGPERDTVRFELWRPSIERQAGLTFEKGKLVEVSGDIDGKYGFVAEHRVGDNQSITIHLPKEFTENVTVGIRHVVNIQSIEEKRHFEVGSRPEPVITISKRALESAGIVFESQRGNRVIEFEMQNLSRQDHSSERYFGTYVDSQKSTRLYVGESGSKVGDRFALIRADENTFANFAKDFNSHPTKETQNVRLSVDDGKLEMQVDGRKFQLNDCRLTTYHLEVGLSARIQQGREIRLWFDGNGIRAVYDSKYKIHRFQASDAGLRILCESKKQEISSNT